MRVLILGGDGYLGWPTAMYLSKRGHDVFVFDSYAKRSWEREMEVAPLQSLPPLSSRCVRWVQTTKHNIISYQGSLTSGPQVYEVIKKVLPKVIIHYAEQPSAPYSMSTRGRAVETQYNNVVGTLNLIFAVKALCPKAHIIKLGTMGEYGTPNIDIEEGWLDVSHNGRMDRCLFPKRPGSFYHLSKVHDSANLEFSCRIWGLRVTDLNQGVVYGIETGETVLAEGLHTSFHYDSTFGTVINRFLAQAAVGHPLTVYGGGGQKRAILNIRDTLRCVELALETPAKEGEFRVFNQFTETCSIDALALMISHVTKAKIDYLPNPRIEEEGHYYNVKNTSLLDLGLVPRLLTKEIEHMYEEVKKHKDKINPAFFKPTTKWREV